MSVFIFTEILESTGLGHYMRCSSLYEGLKRRNQDVEFIINADNSAKKILDNKNINFLNWLELESLEILFKEKKHTVSIIDSYLASPEVYKYIFNHSEKLVCIDDFNRIKYPAKSIILNPGANGKNIDYSDYGSVLTGIDYIILRNHFLFEHPKEIKKSINEILITTGGEDFYNLTPVFIKEVVKIFPNSKLNVIIGPFFKNRKEIYSIKTSNIFLHENPDQNTMVKLMLAADFAISAGGQTIYELSRLGVPMVLFQAGENQSENINGYNTKERSLYIGKPREENFLSNLNYALLTIDSFELRKQMCKNLKQIIDSNGVNRILDYIL